MSTERQIRRILNACESRQTLPDICAGVPLGGNTRACQTQVETLVAVGFLEEDTQKTFVPSLPPSWSACAVYRTTATGAAWLARLEKTSGASRERGHS